MKTLSIAFFSALLSLSGLAFAKVSNPMIRACNQTGALVHVLDLGQPANDEFLFCQYGDYGLVDGLSVMARLDGTFSQALMAYKNNVTGSMETCQENQGSLVKGTDKEGLYYLFCVFNDKSSIEFSTLAKGITSPDNAGLNQGLSL